MQHESVNISMPMSNMYICIYVHIYAHICAHAYSYIRMSYTSMHIYICFSTYTSYALPQPLQFIHPCDTAERQTPGSSFSSTLQLSHHSIIGSKPATPPLEKPFYEPSYEPWEPNVRPSICRPLGTVIYNRIISPRRHSYTRQTII